MVAAHFQARPGTHKTPNVKTYFDTEQFKYRTGCVSPTPESVTRKTNPAHSSGKDSRPDGVARVWSYALPSAAVQQTPLQEAESQLPPGHWCQFFGEDTAPNTPEHNTSGPERDNPHAPTPKHATSFTEQRLCARTCPLLP